MAAFSAVVPAAPAIAPLTMRIEMLTLTGLHTPGHLGATGRLNCTKIVLTRVALVPGLVLAHRQSIGFPPVASMIAPDT